MLINRKPVKSLSTVFGLRHVVYTLPDSIAILHITIQAIPSKTPKQYGLCIVKIIYLYLHNLSTDLIRDPVVSKWRSNLVRRSENASTFFSRSSITPARGVGLFAASMLSVSSISIFAFNLRV